MRRKDREVTDLGEILAIVGKAKILHMGMFDGDHPYVVPLHFGYEFREDTRELVFYMHGAREGHKLDLLRQNANVCIELDCGVELIPGGDDPCRYGSTYASVIGTGRAEPIDDVPEKIKGLNLIMENQTGRPFDIGAEAASSVTVIRATLSSFTAKSRPKAP